MNKGLEAVTKLKQYYDDIWNKDFSDIDEQEQYDIIETELKRLEEHNNNCQELYYKEKCDKQDKVLQIIKDKQVQINRLNRSHSAKQYNLYLPKEMHLTQAEFDLLKELFS